MGLFNKLFGGASPTKKYDAKVAAINALEPQMAALTDAQLRAKTGEFRARLKEGESLDDLLVKYPALNHQSPELHVHNSYYS